LARVKRNILVIVVVLAALGAMIWAGVVNYRRRQQEDAKLKQLQAMIAESASPTNAASESDIPENPLQGKMAPQFTLKDTTGRKVSLADYKGKAVVVDFWATWCAPCKIEIPWLEQFHNQYASQGLEILGISEDDLDPDDKAKLLQEKKDIADKAAQLKINYPVLIDDASVSTPYGGVDGLPTTFFIDRNGKIVASTVGLAPRDEIEVNIKKALSSGGKS
jgi:thiol-disulfide isomerase/thioredoxin